LALAAALLCAPGPLPALAAEPDLLIEHVGFWAPNDDRGIQFRVTNVGTGPASAGKAHIQTLSPSPANIAEPAYPALAPGQSFTFKYELAAPCNGHVVRAGVSATADGERNYDNNFFQGEVCPKKPAPPGAPSGVVLRPPNDDLVIAKPSEDLARPRGDMCVAVSPPTCPGEWTITLPASESHWYYEWTINDPEGCPFRGRQGFSRDYNPVGWSQIENADRGPFGLEFNECNYVWVYETAVTFDYQILDQVLDKRVTGAVLEFDEHAVEWTDGEGRDRPGTGCVAKVGIATSEATYDPAHTLDFNFQPFLNIAPQTATSWDVLEPTVDHTLNRRPRHGFVLQGTHDSSQLEGEDNSKCLSRLENVRLTITYVVP